MNVGNSWRGKGAEKGWEPLDYRANSVPHITSLPQGQSYTSPTPAAWATAWVVEWLQERWAREGTRSITNVSGNKERQNWSSPAGNVMTARLLTPMHERATNGIKNVWQCTSGSGNTNQSHYLHQQQQKSETPFLNGGLRTWAKIPPMALLTFINARQAQETRTKAIISIKNRREVRHNLPWWWLHDG